MPKQYGMEGQTDRQKAGGVKGEINIGREK